MWLHNTHMLFRTHLDWKRSREVVDGWAPNLVVGIQLQQAQEYVHLWMDSSNLCFGSNAHWRQLAKLASRQGVSHPPAVRLRLVKMFRRHCAASVGAPGHKLCKLQVASHWDSSTREVERSCLAQLQHLI